MFGYKGEKGVAISKTTQSKTLAEYTDNFPEQNANSDTGIYRRTEIKLMCSVTGAPIFSPGLGSDRFNLEMRISWKRNLYKKRRARGQERTRACTKARHITSIID